MFEDQPRYLAYLLRLWNAGSDDAPVWHLSLENPHTGERQLFGNLDGLFAFLAEATRLPLLGNGEAEARQPTLDNPAPSRRDHERNEEPPMTETPVQLIVAAFSTADAADRLMEELKQGKKEGLIGIVDAAVVVKDENGKLKVTNAKARSRRRKGFVTGGIVGAALSLLAGPVGLVALGGGALGALAGQAMGTPLKWTMEEIGESLTPNSSAIVAVVEHTWVPQLEAALQAAKARIVRETLKADLAAQLQAGGNVLYTAGAGPYHEGVARIAEGPEGARVSLAVAGAEGALLSDAEFTDEELAEA